MKPGTLKKRGLFITFEGIEGSGKTTLVNRVHQALRNRGMDPVLTREPGGTWIGRSIRSILLDPAAASLAPLAELFLFAADRAQHLLEVVRPALAEGRVVLCDRFSDATLAYQGYGRQLPLERVAEMDRAAREGLTPDLTVLLDVPPELGLDRARRRNAEGEPARETRMDDEVLEFHARVRNGYLELSRAEPDRFLLLDGTQPADELLRLTLDLLESRHPDAF